MFLALQRSFGMQQTVRLLGDLGERYGSEHKYHDLRSPADAIKLLCINSPAFQKELIEAHQHGIAYTLVQAGEFLDYQDLHLPLGQNDLVLTPVVAGSGGGGTGKIILGVALIAAAIFIPGAQVLGIAGFNAALAGTTGAIIAAAGSAIGSIGVSLVLAGTAQLLAPQPVIPNFTNRTKPGENTNATGPQGVSRATSGEQSYAFTGPANTVGTGATIPVIYGRVITGGHLLAANVEVADDSDPLKLETQRPGLQTLRVNGEKLTRDLKSLGGLKSRRGSNLVVNASDSNNDRRIVINKVFGPDGDKPLKEGEILQKTGLEYYRSDRRKKFDVIFQIDKGLFDFAGASGSTKVDGFITYQIKLEVSLPESNDVVAASATATIQGLLLQSHDVTYAHRLQMPRIGDGRKVKIIVEIIDVAVYKNARLKLQAYGYDLL